MNILAFDTTLNRCSVAVVADGKILSHVSVEMRRGHAEALMPLIQDCLNEASLEFSGLDLVAVTTGPGTFTGQRVGLSAARGIGVSTGLPVQGVGSLPAIALSARTDKPDRDILVVQDARRGEFYVQHFPASTDIWPEISPARAVPIEDLSDLLPDAGCVIVGSGTEMARELLGATGKDIVISDRHYEADALQVAELAASIIAAQGLPDGPPAPLYLRAPDAKLPGGKTL